MVFKHDKINSKMQKNLKLKLQLIKFDLKPKLCKFLVIFSIDENWYVKINLDVIFVYNDFQQFALFKFPICT